MKKVPPLVLVEWEDIATIDDSTWVRNTPIKATTPMVFKSVGFLIHDEPERIVITACWNDDLIGPREQYPRGCIRSITVLIK